MRESERETNKTQIDRDRQREGAERKEERGIEREEGIETKRETERDTIK